MTVLLGFSCAAENSRNIHVIAPSSSFLGPRHHLGNLDTSLSEGDVSQNNVRVAALGGRNLGAETTNAKIKNGTKATKQFSK